jgi:hypothetical protein
MTNHIAIRATLILIGLACLAEPSRTAQDVAQDGKPQRVYVTTRGDRPVAGALVQVWPTMATAGIGESRNFETDDKGCAQVVIPSDWKALTARKEGIGLSSIVPSDQKTLRLVEVQRVSGQVVWSDGRPESGALVFAPEKDPELSGSPFAELMLGSAWIRVPPAVTDSEGYFVIEVPRADVPLRAESRGRRTPPRSAALAEMLDEPLVLRFPGAYRVVGKVTGPDCVGGARVLAPDTLSIETLEAEVADDGTFELVLAEPDTYPICAMLDGWVQQNEVVVTVGGAHCTEFVELHLVAATTISGRLTDRDGQPLLSVIWAVPDDIWVREADWDRHDPWAKFVFHRSPSARTNDDGEFILAGIQPGKTYTLCTELWASRGVLTRTLRAGSSGVAFVSDTGVRPRTAEPRPPAALIGLIDRHDKR